jgi:hypothetical protein
MPAAWRKIDEVPFDFDRRRVSILVQQEGERKDRRVPQATNRKELALGSIGRQTSRDAANARRLFGLIVVATLPAVVLGFALEKWLRGLFGSPMVAATFLIVNGFLLVVGDRIATRRRCRRAGIAQLETCAARARSAIEEGRDDVR